MKKTNTSRREFIKNAALSSAGVTFATAFSAKSYANILGANDRVNVGIVGFSNRAKSSLLPAFMNHADALNFKFVAVSDIWNRRRDECQAYFKEQGWDSVKTYRNNEELYDSKTVDAVIVSTADFQHALHAKEAVEAGCDVYCEKPFGEDMDDIKAGLDACESSGKVVQIGSQRRSGPNYHAAADFIKSGKFGDITMVEMCWNVNQPGRWRLPDLVASIRKQDTDWDRFLMNRPKEDWDPRKYLEYRLFWPYSSGIPGQWMSHQIDTVHWFSGYEHPRSVAANGGVYVWKDGRVNPDTMTAVFEYGPQNDPSKGFQVVYSSRMHNSAGGVKEIYFSNAGTLNLENNTISPEGGLSEGHARDMGMQANLLPEMSLSDAVKIETSANTGVDNMTSEHMRNWMECVRDRNTKTNAPARVGYNHAVANIMTTTAMHTGKRVTFDDKSQLIVQS